MTYGNMPRTHHKKAPLEPRKDGAIKIDEHKEVRSYEAKALENVKRKHAKKKFKTINTTRNGFPITVEIEEGRDEKAILEALNEPTYFY